MALIEVKNLKKIYGDKEIKTEALKGVSFIIEKGEFVAIMGPSGSGKSTLMHIMGFLDRPTSGIYKFKGKSIDEYTDDQLAEIRNSEMGFVFQTFNLLPRSTVYENVRLPLIYNNQIKRKEQRKLILKAIKAVGLEKRINHFSNQLSGGEQQRVAIARAIVLSPSVIFADEPTGNLDSKSGQQIMEIFQELNEKGHTIVLVTHESYTAKHAKRIIQLKDGTILSDKIIKDRVFAKNGVLRK